MVIQSFDYSKLLVDMPSTDPERALIRKIVMMALYCAVKATFLPRP